MSRVAEEHIRVVLNVPTSDFASHIEAGMPTVKTRRGVEINWSDACRWLDKQRQPAKATAIQENPATDATLLEEMKGLRQMMETVLEHVLPSTKIVTTEELATMLKVSNRQVCRYIEGGMPGIKVGKGYRIELKPALDWIRKNHKSKTWDER